MKESNRVSIFLKLYLVQPLLRTLKKKIRVFFVSSNVGLIKGIPWCKWSVFLIDFVEGLIAQWEFIWTALGGQRATSSGSRVTVSCSPHTLSTPSDLLTWLAESRELPPSNYISPYEEKMFAAVFIIIWVCFLGLMPSKFIFVWRGWFSNFLYISW